MDTSGQGGRWGQNVPRPRQTAGNGPGQSPPPVNLTFHELSDKQSVTAFLASGPSGDPIFDFHIPSAGSGPVRRSPRRPCSRRRPSMLDRKAAFAVPRASSTVSSPTPRSTPPAARSRRPTPPPSASSTWPGCWSTNCKAVGLADAAVDDNCYVTATLPASPGCEKVPVIAFISHMDTYPEVSGENVVPTFHENYQGGDIELPKERQARSWPRRIPTCRSASARPSSPPTAPPCWAPTTRPASPRSWKP